MGYRDRWLAEGMRLGVKMSKRVGQDWGQLHAVAILRRTESRPTS